MSLRRYLIPVACASMALWGGLITLVFVGLTRLLAIDGAREDIGLADSLLPIVPWSFVVIVAYLIWRLLPVRRILERLQSGERPEPSSFESAARHAMMLPPLFLVGAVVVSIAVSISMFMAGVLAEAREVNVVARFLSVGQALIIVYGMGCYLILRSQLRPVLVALMPRRVPMRNRFGLRWRLMLWVLLLAAIGLTAVMVVDSQATGRLLSEVAFKKGEATEAIGVWPLLSGSALVVMLLVVLFASTTGWRLGQATREPAFLLRGNLERIAEAKRGAAIERLPVYSTTEVGQIAVAFNRLADRLDVEHARLDAYATRIRQTEQLRSRFLANASHELRTPLNAIIGFSDVLLQGFDGDLNGRQHEAVHIISREGERFLRLIDDILLMARFEAEKVILLQQEFGFGELLAEALSAVSPPNPELLQQKTDPSLRRFHIRGDRKKLVRAVSALVEHALFAAGDSRVSLEAEVESATTVRLCLFCPSVPSPELEESERLFEGFRAIHGSEWAAPGVGLGLPLARRIARAHGGETEFIKRDGACGLQISLPGAPAASEEHHDPV